MPDMREGGWGTAACYLTVERLALQAGVESPFWDGASLLMGGCEETWYKKPLTPRRLRSFIKRYGGSLPDDAGQLGQVASVFSDVMRIAPQLAEVRRVYEHDAEERIGGATGRHVAPHVRRGHWHGYWTGPRENPTGLEIKWIAPTVVNGSRGELAGTVHEVGDRDGRYNLKSTRSECGRASEQLNGGSRDSGQLRDGKSDR